MAQKGSNITAERLRFDFTFGRKVTKEELAQVEKLVNQAIPGRGTRGVRGDDRGRGQGPGRHRPVRGQVRRAGASVYTMGDYSKEICGGPHAENTGDLGDFHIEKEESSSAGVRRIKAVLK